MFSKNFLKRWFGYTRRERTGTLVLVVIVVIVATIRLAFFSKTGIFTSAEMGPGEIIGEAGILSQGLYDTADLSRERNHAKILKTFDPNHVTAEELMSLGLTERQSSTVINYRNAGGVFRTPDDFRKIYGISSGQFDELVPYIKIDPAKNSSGSKIIKRGGLMVADEPATRRLSGVSGAENMDSGSIQLKPVETREAIVFDLNRADSSQLVSLKGIGPVLSIRIMKYRALLGGFVSVSQLSEVYGIDSLLVRSFASYLVVDSSLVTPIDINNSEFGDLVRHPYISPEQAGMILDYRSAAGNFSNGGQLVTNRIITHEQWLRLAPYLSGFTREQ